MCDSFWHTYACTYGSCTYCAYVCTMSMHTQYRQLIIHVFIQLSIYISGKYTCMLYLYIKMQFLFSSMHYSSANATAEAKIVEPTIDSILKEEVYLLQVTVTGSQTRPSMGCTQVLPPEQSKPSSVSTALTPVQANNILDTFNGRLCC